MTGGYDGGQAEYVRVPFGMPRCLHAGVESQAPSGCMSAFSHMALAAPALRLRMVMCSPGSEGRACGSCSAFSQPRLCYALMLMLQPLWETLLQPLGESCRAGHVLPSKHLCMRWECTRLRRRGRATSEGAAPCSPDPGGVRAADVNLLKLPSPLELPDEKVVFLSDILPTAWCAAPQPVQAHVCHAHVMIDMMDTGPQQMPHLICGQTCRSPRPCQRARAA